MIVVRLPRDYGWRLNLKNLDIDHSQAVSQDAGRQYTSLIHRQGSRSDWSRTMKVVQLPHNLLFSCRSCLSILGLIVLVLIMVELPAAADDTGVKIDKRTAVARPAAEWDKEGKVAKFNFDFGDFKAWARRDGSWNAAGMVHHRGLLCATYTLSLRVGHGNPGCNDVKWFGEPRPVGSIDLCNSAVGNLTGGNTEFSDASRFDEITCAERALSCSGNCQ